MTDTNLPDLTPVINWLENGCDQKEAARELRLHQQAIDALKQAPDFESLFMQTCFDLGAIHDALGLDPDDAEGAGPIIEAIEELKKSITPQWQPIDTAPRDGTPILASSWHPTLPHLYIPITAYWANYHPNAKGDECWRTSTIGGNKLRGLTHWMPLPAAPGQHIEGDAP